MINQPAQGALPPKAAYHRKGVVRSDLIAFIVLLAFVAAVVAVDRLLRPTLQGPWLVLVGVVLALAPAGLWLFMFYRLDAVEPEPVGDVAKIFVVGLALAGAIGIPLVTQFFRVQDWLYRDTLTTVLGSIFIIGSVEAFIVYATVRFFIFDEPEFDERSDGVIYGTAAGIGYATALNLQFILSSRGAALGPAEIYVAEVALAHAALGGLLGYFLGKAKMQHEPVWWLALGFVLASVLNGLFYLLRGQLETGDISIGAPGGLPTVTGLLLSGAAAVLMSGAAAFLIARDVRLTLEGRMPPRAPDADAHDRLSNGLVVCAFAVMLLVGIITWNGAVNSTTAFEAGPVRGAYPSYFSRAETPGDLLHVVDHQGSGAEYVISASAAPADLTLEQATKLLTVDRASRYPVYKVLDTAKTTVGGKPALMQRYSYVDGGGLGRTDPQLRTGIDYIVNSNGQTIVISLQATPDTLQDATPPFTRFVNGLSL
jgi:RsiW-degrading membrane proteinase PrsW (M82 family)